MRERRGSCRCSKHDTFDFTFMKCLYIPECTSFFFATGERGGERKEADGSDAGLTRSRARGPVQGTDRGWGQRGPHTMAVTYPNDVRQDKGGRRGQVGAEQAGALARATPRGPRRRASSPGLARGPAAAPPASEAPGSPLRGEASAPPPGSPANSPRFFSLLSYSSVL